MDTVIQGVADALQLIVTADPELYKIVFLSLFVTVSAVLVSAFFCVPAAVWVGVKEFPGKRILSRFLFSLMSVPSVIVGLVVFLLLSRRGPLGYLNLLYTPWAMIIAQGILISPLLFGLVFNTVRSNGKYIQEEGTLLGANSFQNVVLIILEMKAELLGNLIAGFSRGISEVGSVMIVGGNIKGQTRVMTTSIAMMNSMGEYRMAIALGIILLLLALGINSLVYKESVR
jgi:tungstate transport system permease protein